MLFHALTMIQQFLWVFPTAHSHWMWNFWATEKWSNLFLFYSFVRQQQISNRKCDTPRLAESPSRASDLDWQKSSWTKATFNRCHKKAEHTTKTNNQELCSMHVRLVVECGMTSQEQAKTGTGLRIRCSTTEHEVQTNKTTMVIAHTSVIAVVLLQFQIVWRSLDKLWLTSTNTGRQVAIVVCTPPTCAWLFNWKHNAHVQSGPWCHCVPW